MPMASAQQRALLRMERSLGKDPALRLALKAFGRSRRCGKEPRYEHLSPWHPFLWRAVSLLLAGLTLAFLAMIIVVAVRMG